MFLSFQLYTLQCFQQGIVYENCYNYQEVLSVHTHIYCMLIIMPLLIVLAVHFNTLHACLIHLNTC